MPVAGAERQGGAHIQRLTDDQARAIAIRFAPRFRFHADEAYLPVHPLFVLETAGQEGPQGPGAAQALGAPVDRIRRYLALTLPEKSAQASGPKSTMVAQRPPGHSRSVLQERVQ